MSERLFNVLFLCRRNSARSIMAEAILRREGPRSFKAFSAGDEPADTVNPLAEDLLRKFNHPTGELKPKGWQEFAGNGAPQMDFVFSVDKNIQIDACPTLPGRPMFAHWGIPDPVGFEGSEVERRALYNDVYGRIYNRISIFVNLPISALDKLSLQRRLDAIGGK